MKNRRIIFEGLKGLREYEPLGFRYPKRGEYYLSGAIPQAWLAPNDLTMMFHVVKPLPQPK